MRNTTLHTFYRPQPGFSVVAAAGRAGVEDDDVKSLRFVFHLLEKPSFTGATKKMVRTQVEYELVAKDDEDDYIFGEMLNHMQLVLDDMLHESNTSLLCQIEMEVERRD